MHPSLVALTLVSLALIIIMLSCFICFTRWRRKEEEELMEQVQYTTDRQTGQSGRGRHRQLGSGTSPISNPSDGSGDMLNNNKGGSRSININEGGQQQQGNREHMLVGSKYQPMTNSTNPYISVTSSPYHQPSNIMGGTTIDPMTDTRSDITQQINSAIIGSSEAEFQNDFIQVS